MQISTDQLFVSKKKFITEITKPKPLNEYSKSKYLAENLVKKRLKNFFLLLEQIFLVGVHHIKILLAIK